ELVSTDSDPITHKSRSISIDSGRQNFRLEIHGPWVEPRGALLFAFPQGHANGHQEFEPAPGLAFQLKYGLKDQPFINRILSPGVGVSFSILDFDDNQAFELGIAGNVSFLMDLLWAGYGRDLQAARNYYY